MLREMMREPLFSSVQRDYPRFAASFEAQSLGAVAPLIRALRPKLPHPVYEIADYRMRSGVEFIDGAPSGSPDEQEIHPCRYGLSGIAPGDHRAGAAAGHQIA